MSMKDEDIVEEVDVVAGPASDDGGADDSDDGGADDSDDGGADDA